MKNNKMLVVRDARNNGAKSIIVDCELIALATATEEQKTKAETEYSDSRSYTAIGQGDEVYEISGSGCINPENSQKTIMNGIIFADDVAEIEAEMALTITDQYHDWLSVTGEAVEAAGECQTEAELKLEISKFKKAVKKYKKTDAYEYAFNDVLDTMRNAYEAHQLFKILAEIL